MKQFLFYGKKKQLIVFGILLALISIPFNLVGQETIDRDDNVFLTALEPGWNLVSLRYDATLYKEDLVVNYGGTDYSWNDAVAAGIMNNYIYKWNSAGQYYSFSVDTDPSYGYWMKVQLFWCFGDF